MTLNLVRGGFGTVQIPHTEALSVQRTLGSSVWPNLREAKKAAKAAGYTEIHFCENPGGQRPHIRVIRC